jgi:protease-4
MTLLHRAFTLTVCMLAVAGCDGGDALPVVHPGPQARELRIESLPKESPEEGLFASAATHHALLERLRELEQDDDVRGILVRMAPLGGAFARARELSTVLATLRAAKKPVHCYFENADNASYFVLASACDRISMAPGGILDLVGVGSEVMYVADLLKTLGLRAELIQIGRFKGAADTFTRNDMPPEVRETTEALVKDLHQAIVGAVVEGRRMDAAAVQASIDAGPLTAEQARARGLIDDVGFDDEARLHLRQAAKVSEVRLEALEPDAESMSLSDLIGALTSDTPESSERGDRIALAHLDGTILTGSEEVPRSAHSMPFVKALRRFGDLPEVKAVVLRIDSPGGSALASDAMWHAVRRVAKRKPVIVSIGDMAASGGYYVASAGTRIFAEDESIVGSIGVVGGKIVGEELTTRLGVRSERIAAGKRAGWSSALHAFSEDERAMLTGLLEDTYTRFLDRVAEGRGVAKERILPLAEGRIMSGRRAREGGLVDERGGLREALAHARAAAKLPSDAQVEVWPKHQTLLEQLTRLTGSAASAPTSATQIAHAILPRALREGLPAALIAGGDVQLAVLPFVLDLE